jgi:hypothetical protein
MEVAMEVAIVTGCCSLPNKANPQREPRNVSPESATGQAETAAAVVK